MVMSLSCSCASALLQRAPVEAEAKGVIMNHTGKEAPRAPHENPEKDPDDWTTGDEPMTGAQRSYLKTLCQEAGEEFDENLSKAEASKRIDELQEKTGRRP
jgi:hypothetical protein